MSRSSVLRPGRWTRILALLSAAAVGFALVGQLRSEPGLAERLEVESEEDLARILAGLNDEAAALRDEITELRIQLRLLESSAESEELAREAAEREVRQLEVLSGVVPATGPGVVLRVDDPFAVVDFRSLLDVVQELRNARAEAIAVNGHRVGARTFVTGDGNQVLLSGTPLDAPYLVEAIGDPGTLEGGLQLPGGALDRLGALPGVEVAVERQAELVLPALDEPVDFAVAEPVDD